MLRRSNMKKLLTLLTMMAVISSGSAYADSVLDTEYKGADTGFLVSSIGFTQPELTTYDMYYRPVPARSSDGKKAIISISSRSIFDGRDYKNETVQGRVVIHHLKPGTYELYEGHAGGDNYWMSDSISYTFVITPGETTYIGSFVGSRTVSDHDKNIWGGYIINGASIQVADEHERDFTAARKHEANLPPIAETMVPNMPTPLLIQKRTPIFMWVAPG